MTKNTNRRNYFERVREQHGDHDHETIQIWGVPVPQVDRRTENTDKSNKDVKILTFKMSFVEKGEEKKKKKADLCIYKPNGKGE